jgi:PhoD related phosphatase
MLKLGPVLRFLGCEKNEWRFSVLAVTADIDLEPEIKLVGNPISLKTSLALPNTKSKVWIWEGSTPMSDKTQTVQYSLNKTSFSFNIPAKNQKPSIAFSSCNGFSDPTLMKNVSDQNALWKRMKSLHDGVDTIKSQRFGPWHILLMGGDQIYSDAMWNKKYCRSLSAWAELSWSQRKNRAFTSEMQKEVERFFEDVYITRWSQPEISIVMASIPSIMMWDDHDIFDGWGSYPFDQHNCPVYQGIFNIARKYFKLFQLQSVDALPRPRLPEQDAFSQGYRFADLGLLVLDMRSERMPKNPNETGGQLLLDQVMSDKSWNAIYKWMEAQQGLSHLIVMSSIPVVHPSMDFLEKTLGFIPGQQELEDDFLDQWRSQAHKLERLRMIQRLLRFSAEKNCRVTILSGDVHVAAAGALESDRNDVAPNARVINQLTSSGIVHPAPPAIVRAFLEQACKLVETVDRGITATMYEFPATSRRIIGARNFLTLEPEPNPQNRLWVNWWVEGEVNPTTKVIHPVQSKLNAIEPNSKLI